MDVRFDADVMVPMRDGVRLATDIYRPLDAGPVPVLLVRLPYGKRFFLSVYGVRTVPDVLSLVRAGYAVVWQDVRGLDHSEGIFTAFENERCDGEDTLAWLLAQDWCIGKVGSYGPSYLGITQWHLAGGKSDGLAAMVPTQASPSHYRAGPLHHQGGLMGLGSSLTWSLHMVFRQWERRLSDGSGGACDPATLPKLIEVLPEADRSKLLPVLAAQANPQEFLERLPISDRPELAIYARWYGEWIDHDCYDEYWRGISPGEVYENVDVPALHVGGWFDPFVGETASAYVGMKKRASSQAARSGQRLVIGPWAHGDFTGVFSERDFGPMAGIMDLAPMHISFFDRWLRGVEGAIDDSKPVRIFVMGLNQWRDEEDWPLPDTVYTSYFLHSAGRANSSVGDGVLSAEEPNSQTFDAYLYNPRRPVPTHGGYQLPGPSGPAGPTDQSVNERRDDVLCYTTSPLDRPLEVTGPISLVLHVSSSAPDTDFIAKLIDVDPDGRALFLTEGALRARYRNSVTRQELLTPGEIYQIELDMFATSNVFLPGHRLRLEITSSNFPRFDRNTNTGGKIAYETEDDFVCAINQIHHGRDRLSRLILPIIDRA
jgi:putative CocE/NonD family hydrolase